MSGTCRTQPSSRSETAQHGDQRARREQSATPAGPPNSERMRRPRRRKRHPRGTSDGGAARRHQNAGRLVALRRGPRIEDDLCHDLWHRSSYVDLDPRLSEVGGWDQTQPHESVSKRSTPTTRTRTRGGWCPRKGRRPPVSRAARCPTVARCSARVAEHGFWRPVARPSPRLPRPPRRPRLATRHLRCDQSRAGQAAGRSPLCLPWPCC